MRSTDISYIAYILETGGAVRLLRSRYSAFVISFLYRQFREKHRQVVESGELERFLTDFLQEYADSPLVPSGAVVDEDGLSQLSAETDSRARQLLTFWCSETCAYLRRYHDERGVAVVEPSSSLEKLFRWIEDLEPQEFVGTESRFRDILFKLRDLDENTSIDPKMRVAELKKRRKEIDAQIAEIQKTGKAEVYSPVQIRERLQELSRSSRELLSDFNLVEEKFRAIVADLYQEQTKTDAGRGSLLGYTLDASAAMRESPQGQSFEAFWRFLAEDTGKNEINEITSLLLSRIADQGVEWNDGFLLKLKYYLHAAGKKVLDANHVLSDRLNRVLGTNSSNEHRRIKELISEIKSLVIANKDREIAGDEFLHVEGKPELYFPQARFPVLPTAAAQFVSMQQSDGLYTSEQVQELVSQFYIDQDALLRNIADITSKCRPNPVPLSQVIRAFPVQKGLAEIMTYFDIASRSASALIRDDETETLLYENEQCIGVTAPKVVFYG